VSFCACREGRLVVQVFEGRSVPAERRREPMDAAWPMQKVWIGGETYCAVLCQFMCRPRYGEVLTCI
jgi:hypothetical protein